MGLARLNGITAFGEDLMESSESVPSVLHLSAKAQPHSQSSPELGQSLTAELWLVNQRRQPSNSGDWAPARGLARQPRASF